MENTTKSWQRDDVQHDWTEWSDCDWSLTRTRSRNCSNCDSNQERVPCISSESFNDELELLQGEHDPKPVAQTFEEAGQHVQSDIRRSEQGERSLFGDNDYSNQEEVSYFGPPYQSRHVGTPDEDDGIINPQPNIFNIHSNIKKIRPEEAHRHAGLTGNLNSNEQTKNHRTQDVNHHRQDVAQRGGHFNHQNGHEQLVDQENLHEQNSDQDHLHQQQVDQQTQEETPFLGDLKPEDLKLSGLQSAELQLFQQAQSEAEREANREIRGFKGDVDHIQFNRDDPSRLDIVKGPYSVGRLPDGGIGENGVPRGSVFDQSAPEGRAFDQRAPRGSASEQKTPEGKKSNSMVSKVPKGVPKADIFIPSGTEFTNNGAKRGLNIRKLPLNPESDGENSHKLRLEPSVNLQDQSRLHRELQSPETMYGGLQGQNSLESRLQNPKLLHDSLQNTSSHHKGLQNPSSIPTTLQNQNPSQNSLQNPISHHDALQNTEETPRTHVPTPLLESDIKGCDAHQKCCPVASGATLKGCVIGFRIGENGVKTTCLTDRCT
ncbi:unnamed protein product [Bursaphelenchus okinawaensis]|uniref:Uncharacterized protein n=1 Tax=Bursaphelenchus okinawaensis TaxID=465554 RepID=A0A811LRT8_9BILA|nr:unnamed protein product [Bursaphelenchus okinawaensis]CAG9127497.1 unnamed protein product [Bursaphelenchus okinawaensis]